MIDLILAHATFVILWLTVGFVSGVLGTILYNSSRSSYKAYSALLTVGDLMYAFFILSLSGFFVPLFIIVGLLVHWISKSEICNKRIL